MYCMASLGVRGCYSLQEIMPKGRWMIISGFYIRASSADKMMNDIKHGIAFLG